MSLWKRFKERYPKADETKFKTRNFSTKKQLCLSEEMRISMFSMGIILEVLFIFQMI